MIILVCPKCQEGIINKIIFRKDNRVAYVCDFCESLWFEGERIGLSSGHSLSSFSEDEDYGYATDQESDKDQDHEPIARKYE